jgi:hypothetical protein
MSQILHRKTEGRASIDSLSQAYYTLTILSHRHHLLLYRYFPPICLYACSEAASLCEGRYELWSEPESTASS